MAQPPTVLASSNFLVPNATFIAELIAFVLILAILAKYILPPIQKATRDRQAMIARQVADADEARKQLAEAQRTVEDLKAQGQEESARIVARGEEQLARQRGAIVRELRAEIGTLAVELAEKIVDQRLSDDAAIRGTVDSFLADIEHQQAGEQR